MGNIWLESEADHYFRRNQGHFEHLLNVPLQLLEMYSISPGKILEIGGVNGTRLAQIYKKYVPCVAACIEASKEAIADGNKRYPFIEFYHGVCEDISQETQYDVIILSCPTLSWTSRENLYTCVRNIDRWVADQGYVIVDDFGVDGFFKRPYHHRPDAQAFTWKMPYWKLFTDSGKYLELAKLRFNHDTQQFTPNLTIDNMQTVVLLRKQELFLER